MKLALIGNGSMGRLVARQAGEQGHQIAPILTSRDTHRTVEELAGELRKGDVAIDFSVATAVPKNVEACALAGVPLVEGTTGWHASVAEVSRIVNEANAALIYGANFSLGVQIFYRIAARAAEAFRNLESYDAFIEEAHHKGKRDAPSGTAIQLGDIVASHLGRDVPVTSTRAGYIPGTHRVGFDSSADQITLTHMARGREGFAAGALLAAEWIVGRKGIYEFSEVFEQILQERKPQL